ncbi:MAG: IS3 family transposase [Bacilli bacterium]|nr:IS3 family transposase [Bacilli bacterium]
MQGSLRTKAKICIKRSTSNIRTSKSIYYYYEHQNETDKYHDIKILISEIFEASNKTYGYRRIKLALQNFYQIKISYKTVVKLMKDLHIICKVRKKRYRYIYQISNKITPNLLKREFKKNKPNIVWVTEVSEFRYSRKRLYLSVIQDLYKGEIKAYQISRSQNQDLILKTLKKAINPNEDLSKLLIHSDQGILYQSPKYRNYLKKSSFTQSMSEKVKLMIMQ